MPQKMGHAKNKSMPQKEATDNRQRAKNMHIITRAKKHAHTHKSQKTLALAN